MLPCSRLFPVSTLSGLLLALILAVPAGAQNPPVGVRLIEVASESTAESVRARLEAGDAFAPLAREYSLDTTASAGGFLGFVNAADLRDEFRSALEGLEPGEVSPITPLADRYILLQIVPAAEQAWIRSGETARLALMAGDGVAAEAAFEAAAAAARQMGPAGRGLLAESLADLSALMQVQQRLPEARQYYRDSIEAAWAEPTSSSEGIFDLLESFVAVMEATPFGDDEFDAQVGDFLEHIGGAAASERLFWALVGLLDDAGLTDVANPVAELAVERFPDSLTSARRLADYYFDIGMVPSAVAAYERAITMDPPDQIDPELGILPESYFWQKIGSSRDRLLDYESAVLAYQKALEIDDGNPQARFELGIVHLENDAVDRALLQLEAMLETNRTNADVLYRLAQAYLESGDGEQAVRYGREAVRIAPDHRRARYELGRALIQTGEIEAGRAELTRSSALESAETEAADVEMRVKAAVGVARGVFRAGLDEEGLETYEDARASDPNVAVLGLYHAYALGRLSQWSEAVRVLEMLLAGGISDSALLHRHLARAEEALGNAGAADAEWMLYLQRVGPWLNSALE